MSMPPPPVPPGMTGPSQPQPSPELVLYETIKRAQSGADWFLWIAGFSLVNALIVLIFHGSFSFVIGLGSTFWLAAIASGEGTAVKAVIFAITLVIAGIYVLIGILARKRLLWAFWVGMVLYLLDALLLFKFQAWWNLAFHGYALFCIFTGLKAAMAYRTLEQQMRQYPVMPPPYPPAEATPVEQKTGQPLP